MTNPIRVGHIDLSFHDAASREVEDIIESHGHKVLRSAAPHEEMFRQLGAGEIDILCAAWLPASHSVYLDPIRQDVVDLTVLYAPYCIWGVPDYVPQTDVSEVSDLLRSPALEQMDRLIQGINPGAGISRFSKTMITEYGLDKAGYSFQSGTEQDCFNRFIKAIDEKRWVVIPLWHPQWLHNRYSIRALEDPKGLLGGRDEATLVMRKDAIEKLRPSALKALKALHLGNNTVSAADDALQQHL